MMARALIFCLTLLGLAAQGATVWAPMSIWPAGAPGEKGAIAKEQDLTTAKDRLVGGRQVIRWGNVSDPTITIYVPSKRKANGTAVLVCPGGGYTILALDLEGVETCQWLNSLGITAVLLKYRVPTLPGDTEHIAPLQDAQRAMGIIRFHAREWGIDPHRIGVIGFSASGHLMAHLCGAFERREYQAIDDDDAVSCRPDFALGIYPAYLVAKKSKTQLVPEIKVTKNSPPIFLVQTEDDPVYPECALTYYLALKNANVPAELHLYAKGGHGYGLRPTTDAVTKWPEFAAQWLRGMHLLEKQKH